MSNPPLLSPLFRVNGTVLEYKPYDEFPTWTPMWDLSAFVPEVSENNNNGYTFSPKAFKTVNGGFAGATYSTAVWLNTFWLMSGLNAEVSIDFNLQAGDYSISMLWVKGAASGDVTAYLDGVSLGAAAGYNATNQNAEWSWLAEDVAAGLHTLSLKITGKQPASSGHNFALSQVSVRVN